MKVQTAIHLIAAIAATVALASDIPGTVALASGVPGTVALASGAPESTRKDLEDSIASFPKFLIERVDKISSATSDIAQEIDEIFRMVKSELKEADEQPEAAKVELIALRAKNAEQGKQLDAANAKINYLDGELKKFKKLIEALKADLAIANAKIKNLKDEIISLKADLAKAARIIKDLQDEMKSLKADLAKANGKIKDLQKEVKSLKDQINALKTENGNLRSDLAAKDKEIGELKTVIGGKDKEIGELKTVIGGKQEAIVAKENTITGLNNIIKNMAKKIEECEGNKPSVVECGKKGSVSRIINGYDAGHGEFPWQISLRVPQYGHICGGALIGRQYVLLAAHCFSQSQDPNIFTVRVGEHYLKQNDGTEQDFAVAEVHVHESFNSPTKLSNDIALLKLARPVDFRRPYAGPACLPPEGQNYRGHHRCILSGWGLVNRNPATPANRLQKIYSNIWTDYDLRGEWEFWTLPDHVLGFGDVGRGGACLGDFGGPLVCPNDRGRYDIVGVASFGAKDCKSRPGVFTEVSQYRDWISAKSNGAV